jgi:hypothetical protein
VSTLRLWLRWLGGQAYGLWISLFPPKESRAPQEKPPDQVPRQG